MRWGNNENNYIASLDPLGVDEIIKNIPTFNETKDLKKLIEILNLFCSKADITTRNYFETAAIVRDLGIVMGSIKRHDLNPIQESEKLSKILINAGKQNDLLPRDTLMHYTLWNPKDHRIRTYTANPQEPFLIESIRISLPKIQEATRDLFELMHINLNSTEALELAFRIDGSLRDFLNGLKYAKEHVEPSTFIRNFRPYFEPIKLNNQILRGPGAVTMPLHIFDFLLWGCSERSEQYHSFTKNYVPYNLAEFRNYYLRAVNGQSFLDKLEKLFSTKKDDRKFIFSVLFAVNNWFKRIEGFRSSHTKYAVDAYQGNEAHNFKTGSGGHTISDLGLIANLTEIHSQRAKNILSKI